MPRQVIHRHRRHLPHLGAGDRLGGRTEIASRARPHLDEHDRPMVVADDVDFAMPGAVAARKNCVPARGELADRQIFACFSELLARVQATGSILKAARRMGMSYMRAWTLLKTMNRCFKEPLVSTVRGGSKGGGSELTPTGKRVLALYRQAERQSFRATQAAWKELLKLMRD